MNHVVMFSGGIASWAAAKRVVESHGSDDVTLLFCDTLIEDEDLYRFLKDASENIGAELVTIVDGRTPFDVFRDVRFMGNSRVDPCSRILKRELADDWIAERYTPGTVRVYVGIDWTEEHRFVRMAERKKPWVYESPLLYEPLLSKPQIFEWAKREGLEPPRLYLYGFPHNNCGGFCVKSGQAQLRKLWESFPDRYRKYEMEEQSVFQTIGSERPFLRITQGGGTRYVSMKTFREEYLEGSGQCDLFDWGGCGCFSDDDNQQGGE